MSAELVARLEGADAGARRVAILDLIALAGHDPGAGSVLLAYLDRESDERAALLIIRHVGKVAGREALPVLWRLQERRQTPARIAHAAIVEHDRIIGRT